MEMTDTLMSIMLGFFLGALLVMVLTFGFNEQVVEINCSRNDVVLYEDTILLRETGLIRGWPENFHPDRCVMEFDYTVK